MKLSEDEKMAAWGAFAESLREALRKKRFSNDLLWLTFGISAWNGFTKEQLAHFAMKGLGNLEGWEGATVYAKLATQHCATKIEQATREMFEFCDADNLELFEVSLDTACDVETSEFQLLTRFVSATQSG